METQTPENACKKVSEVKKQVYLTSPLLFPYRAYLHFVNLAQPKHRSDKSRQDE